MRYKLLCEKYSSYSSTWQTSLKAYSDKLTKKRENAKKKKCLRILGVSEN